MSSDEDDIDDGATAAQGKKGLALRMQKKLLGMSIKSKGAAKNLNLIDDNTG